MLSPSSCYCRAGSPELLDCPLYRPECPWRLGYRMLQSHYARPPPPSPASLPHEAALACDCRTPDPRTTTTNHPNVTKFRYRISAEHRTPHNTGTPHKTHTKKSELHAVPKRPCHPTTSHNPTTLGPRHQTHPHPPHNKHTTPPPHRKNATERNPTGAEGRRVGWVGLVGGSHRLVLLQCGEEDACRGGCARTAFYIYMSGLFCGVWTPVWGRGSPWVPPLVEASLPCSRFVVCATAPAPLGFCAGGGCPSDGRF